jgi:hypothetical protein
MESIYRSKKRITRIAYIPMVFILFLALNSFNVSSGTSSDGGGLEVITGGQSIVLNHTILTAAYCWENIKDTYNREQIKNTGATGIVNDYIFLLLLCLIWRYKSILLWRSKYTLVSLCVRMDE